MDCLLQIKKHQEFITRILELRSIKFDEIDITLAGNDAEKDFMRKNAPPSGNQKVPIPPQIFAGEEYLGVSYTTFYLHLNMQLHKKGYILSPVRSYRY